MGVLVQMSSFSFYYEKPRWLALDIDIGGLPVQNPVPPKICHVCGLVTSQICRSGSNSITLMCLGSVGKLLGCETRLLTTVHEVHPKIALV
ncbi:hypothetical protein AVEN_144642-1 [Araneus ventricosus]|uniref:Uncharacterized protein n=1 Tax=Araneus ventricosus TaxID=182803 RepID=A0A4Y2DZE0_ARAVE|nr:hypothetical protein AVEN_144642-1 [Araneus ventricosus]